MQRANLEWVIRLAQEPGRLGRRYAHDAVVFFPLLARYRRVTRRYRTDADSLWYDVARGDVLITVKTGGNEAGGQWQQAGNAAARAATVRIDLGPSSRLSLGSVRELVGLVRVARRAGALVDHRPLSSSLTEQLRSLGLATYLGAAEANR